MAIENGARARLVDDLGDGRNRRQALTIIANSRVQPITLPACNYLRISILQVNGRCLIRLKRTPKVPQTLTNREPFASRLSVTYGDSRTRKWASLTFAPLWTMGRG
jgi:hypothetical protein